MHRYQLAAPQHDRSVCGGGFELCGGWHHHELSAHTARCPACPGLDPLVRVEFVHLSGAIQCLYLQRIFYQVQLYVQTNASLFICRERTSQ